MVDMGEKEEAEKENERVQGNTSQVITCVVFNFLYPGHK